MPKFTVWFRVGLDFKETIEAEDVHDAEEKISDKVDSNFLDAGGYHDRILESYKTDIYDIVEEKTDVS